MSSNPNTDKRLRDQLRRAGIALSGVRNRCWQCRFPLRADDPRREGAGAASDAGCLACTGFFLLHPRRQPHDHPGREAALFIMGWVRSNQDRLERHGLDQMKQEIGDILRSAERGRKAT